MQRFKAHKRRKAIGGDWAAIRCGVLSEIRFRLTRGAHPTPRGAHSLRNVAQFRYGGSSRVGTGAPFEAINLGQNGTHSEPE